MTNHGNPVGWEKKMFWATLILSLIGMVATHEWNKTPLASEEAVRQVALIDQRMRDSAPPARSLAHRAAVLGREWERPAPQEPGGNWTVYHQTVYIPNWVKGPPPQEGFPVPVPQVAAADFSGVRIEWDVPKTETPAGVMVKSASSARLERRGPGDADYRTIETDVDPESGSATDSKVAPRLAYSYRLVLEGDGRTAISNTAEAQMPDDRSLRWTGGRGGLYILVVKRWFGPTAGWMEQSFNVRIGEAIGGEVQRRVGGKWQTLDFKTGWVLRGFRAGGSMLPGAPGPRPVDALEYGEPGGEALVITQEDPVANGR